MDATLRVCNITSRINSRLCPGRCHAVLIAASPRTNRVCPSFPPTAHLWERYLPIARSPCFVLPSFAPQQGVSASMHWFYTVRVPNASRVDTLPTTVSFPCPLRAYAIATDTSCMSSIARSLRAQMDHMVDSGPRLHTRQRTGADAWSTFCGTSRTGRMEGSRLRASFLAHFHAAHMHVQSPTLLDQRRYADRCCNLAVCHYEYYSAPSSASHYPRYMSQRFGS